MSALIFNAIAIFLIIFIVWWFWLSKFNTKKSLFKTSEKHTLIASFDTNKFTLCNKVIEHKDNQDTFSILWNARNHRKRGHHTILHDGQVDLNHNVQFKFFGWEWRNLSWWVPFLFTLGSIVWLLNGYFSMWPIVDSKTQAELLSWTAFTGGLIFLLGAYASILEVINRPRYIHLRLNKPSARKSAKGSKYLAHHSHDVDSIHPQPEHLNFFKIELNNWGWWLNIFQLIGATIFYISCLFGVVYVFVQSPEMTIACFWLPQMIGAVFFILSSIMAMLEVQDKFYLPAFSKLGWHSAFYNLIGAIGFYLCAYYGAYFNQQEILYWGSNFSTFWGSIAFLLASYLMLLEVINP